MSEVLATVYTGPPPEVAVAVARMDNPGDDGACVCIVGSIIFLVNGEPVAFDVYNAPSLLAAGLLTTHWAGIDGVLNGNWDGLLGDKESSG